MTGSGLFSLTALYALVCGVAVGGGSPSASLVKMRTRPPPAVKRPASQGRSRPPTITISGSPESPFASRRSRCSGSETMRP